MPDRRVGVVGQDAPTIIVVPTSSESRSLSAASGLEIRPFRALTYRRRDPGHLARVSSPAYDLVTPAGRDLLAGADPHNIVRLILPRCAADEGGTADRDPARQAAAMLASWQKDGILDRDAEPALWLYELRPPGDAPATVGWLGAVALPPAGSAAVLPHEDTYPGAVEDRRALLAATGTDLEPIVLAHDPEATVAELTSVAGRGDPTLELQDSDGVGHRLWRVTDPPLLARITAAFRTTGAVIADGHHRFAAARAHSRTEPQREGSDAVLALVTPMGPGGLRVAPIHRVVPDLSLDAALTSARLGFRVTAVPVRDGDQLTVVEAIHRWLATADESGLLVTDGHQLYRLTDPSEAVVATVPTEAPPAWRHLDVVLAHHGLLGGLWQRGDDPESVLIAHTAQDAVRTAAERNGVALILRAPSPADVAAVARAGARMPRKSTLFVPKPRTGLVLRPLAD
jgi:uncharacterized protein (DUF1015 family)